MNTKKDPTLGGSYKKKSKTRKNKRRARTMKQRRK